ncbi:MAG: hypothetical protein ACYTGZ_18750 [Planctomycetota bacterium]|jgi:hypothetical protein
MTRLLVFALLLAACGCKSKAPVDNTDTAVPHDKLVLTKDPRSSSSGRFGNSLQSEAPPGWFDEQLRVIQKEIAAGEFEAAIRRAYAMRDRRPTAAHAAQLDQLLQKANLAVLELPTLRGEFEAVDEPIAVGDSIRVRVRLTNLGRRPIRIPLRFEGSSDSLFEFDVVCREWDTRSHVVTDTRRFRIPLERDWEIPAGGTTEQLIDVGQLGNGRGLNGFRVFAVRGRLRPARLEMGALRRWESVSIAPCYLRSFRPNWEHLADDPLRRIQQAIEKSASTHLLTATALLAPEEKQAAVDILVEELRGDRVIDWAILGALEYLTRIELGRDANAWKAWWPRVRDSYFELETEVRPVSGPQFEVGR